MKVLLLSLVLASGAEAAIDCTANVTINPVLVTVEDPGGPSKMTVLTNTGTEYSGIANYTRSVPRRTKTFFLQLNFQYQPAISLEVADDGRMALCLKANECYACR